MAEKSTEVTAAAIKAMLEDPKWDKWHEIAESLISGTDDVQAVRALHDDFLQPVIDIYKLEMQELDGPNDLPRHPDDFKDSPKERERRKAVLIDLLQLEIGRRAAEAHYRQSRQ